MSKEQTEKAVKKMLDDMPNFIYTVKFEAIDRDFYNINITSTISSQSILMTRDILKILNKDYSNVKIKTIKKEEV